jgi:glycine hydroxymethyltransferase
MISTHLQSLLDKELLRQQNSLELIASENYVSNTVISAYANIFTNKYSEGYPGKRYYGGNEVVDELERYTQGLALKIFGLEPEQWGVNVQPLSGSVANLAVYTGLLQAWDVILGMDLAAWGHLTHGMKLNASGKYFNFFHYGVDKNGTIDYDNLKELAIQHKPKLILAGFSSYPRNVDWGKFIQVKQELKAQYDHDVYLMADIAHIAGLLAWDVLPQCPFDAGFDIVATTTHKTLRWPRWALIYYNKTNNQNIEKDINRWVFPWVQGWPFDHVLVAKATAFEEILDPQTDWKWYCNQIIKNTQTLANELTKLGWDLATGGSDNHLIVLNVTRCQLPVASDNNEQETGNRQQATEFTGKTAEKLFEEIWLSVNKQLIPNDPRPPLDPSGLRIGTPAITTRWLIEKDMITIAHIIHNALTNMQDKQILHEQVLQLCKNYPLWYK